MRATAMLAFLFGCAGLPGVPDPATVRIAVTSPSPGDELEEPSITIAGRVTTTDSSYGQLHASVNGVAVDIDKSGGFSVEITPVVGINHIVVDASDGLSDPARQELDVLWAPEYVPPASTAFTIPDALDLVLGQRFFDGRQLGTTLDMSGDPIVAQDLGAALELILWNIDLASLLTGGIHVGTGSSTLDIDIPAAQPAEVTVDAQIAGPSELDLSIDLDGVFLSTSGSFQYSGNTMTVAGGISADMHASARLVMSVLVDGSIDVTVQDVTATVGPLVPSFTGPDADTLDGFIRVGNNDFRLLVEKIIKDTLIPTFTNKVPPLIEELLGATDKLLDNLTFSLDAKLGGAPVMVTLDGSIAALDVVPGPAIGQLPGHVTVRQTVSISTASAPIHTASHGAMRVSATPVLPTTTAGLGIVMSQDFLNALLHSLWNSGLLEGTAMVGGFNAGISAKLPPVVIPTPDESSCAIDGIRCDVIVELGQVEVQLPDFEQSFAIHASAGARIVVNGTQLSLVIAQKPDVVVWETSEVAGRLSVQAVHDLVVNVVWPQLFESIGSNLNVTLPIPDLSALGLDSLSPSLANAKLELSVRDHATVTAGYLGLGADVQLATPHP